MKKNLVLLAALSSVVLLSACATQTPVPPVPVAKLGKTDATVTFGYNSSDIGKGVDTSSLDQFAQKAALNSDAYYVIVGAADKCQANSKLGPQYNYWLGGQRALAVSQYLEDKVPGIQDKFIAVGASVGATQATTECVRNAKDNHETTASDRKVTVTEFHIKKENVAPTVNESAAAPQ